MEYLRTAGRLAVEDLVGGDEVDEQTQERRLMNEQEVRGRGGRGCALNCSNEVMEKEEKRTRG